MQIFLEKLKEYIYYLICKEHPATEYAVGAVDTFNDTAKIIGLYPWTSKPREAVMLFFVRYAKTAGFIVITGVLWESYGKKIAEGLFYAFPMPNWMLPICLCIAMNIFSRILGEVKCCLGAN